MIEGYNFRMSEPPRNSRREFLAGRAAVEALANLLPAVPPEPAELTPPADASGYLIQVGRTAMACEFEIFLNGAQYSHGPDAALEALDLVERLEDQLSVYRGDSEVSRLNRRAATEFVPIERCLFALLRQAVELWRRTGGAFDITSGPLTKAWGFYRRQGRVPPEDELAAARASVGSQHLEWDEADEAVRFARPGMEINLGAIGKGYALDRCADQLSAAGVGDFLLHGGTSSVVARGSRAGSSPERPGWSVALRHPLRPDRRLAEFRLVDRALGTSGSGNQFFFHQGRRLAHVIDPRSGRPAEQVLSATVLAPTAAEADALSTAFFVGGEAVAAEYCGEHPEVAAALVLPAAGSGASALRAFNLTDADWRRDEPGD